MPAVLIIPLKIYIFIINSIAIVTSKIPRVVRNFLTNMAMLVLLCIGIINHCNDSIHDFINYKEWSIYVGAIMLVALSLGSIDRKIDFKQVKPNITFWIGWIICFGLMFGLSFINPVNRGYYWWSVTSLFIYPLFFVVWSQREDISWLYRVAARNTIALSFVFFILNICIVPFMTRGDYGLNEGYVGIAAHPNNNGLICGAFYSAALYLLLVDSKHRFRYLLSIGISIAITVIATSRTTELAMIMQTFLAVAFYCRSYNKQFRNSFKAKNVIACIVIVAFVAVATAVVFHCLDQMTLVSHAADKTSVSQLHLNDDNADINSISNGRINLWKAYIDRVSFWGNGGTFGPIVEVREDSKWAHNNALDVLYRSGVLACMGYIIWLGSCLVFVLKCFKKRSDRQEELLFVIIVILGYFVQAMLEITIFPLTTSVVLLAYLGIALVAFRNE